MQKMKTVFLTWSGMESKQTAEILSNILSSRFNEKGINFFYSPEEIENGEIWINKIMKKLSGCCFGIVCLSSTNSESPWLNFETGAIVKGFRDKSKIFVFNPVKINPSKINGPLKMFQITNQSLNIMISELYIKINNILDEVNKYTIDAIAKISKQDTVTYIDLLNKYNNEPIDLFISFPIKGLSSPEIDLPIIESVINRLEEKEFTTFCSAVNRTKVNENLIGLERINLIKKCKAYVIIHPEATVSFTLVECGIALALNKPTLIIGKNTNENYPSVLVNMSNVGTTLECVHFLNSYSDENDLFESINSFASKQFDLK